MSMMAVAPVAISLFALLAQPPEPAPVPRGRALMTEIALVEDGRPTADIAVPDDAHHRALAERVREAVEEATGARLPVIGDGRALATLGERNLVVIGNLMTNAVAARLYHNYYVASDAAHPEAGLPELRTVHDPEALGIGVVFCGGSDAEGLAASVERLLAHIEPGRDLVLPHLVETETPDLAQPLTEEALAEKLADAGPPYGAVELLISQGLSYYRSGNAAYLEACRAAIATLLPALAQEEHLTNLYGIAYLGPVWDQIEEAPVFSDEDRAVVCGFLLGCVERCERLHALDAPADRPVHYGFAEKGGNLASLYLNRFCPGMPAAEEAARRLRHFYEMQSRFWKPANEANGYQTTYATEIALWCLTNGEFAYMDSGNLARQCEYQMNAIISNYPYNTCFGDSGGTLANTSTNLLRIGAWYYGDGRYQWFNDFLGWGGHDWNLHHSYATDVPPVEPADLYGVTVIPAEKWCYRAGADEPGAPPRERAYDKVVFRSRLDRDADYLLLDGLSNFTHGHADANQIICYTDQGMWALSTGGYMVKELAEHNVVVVFRDGQGGTGAVPLLADLELVADGRDVGAVRSTLHHYNGADWSRNILWAKGRYFLVIDEVFALEPAEFVLQNWWKLFRGPTQREGRTVVSGEETQCRISGLDTAAVAQRVSRYNKAQYQETVTASLRPGESVAFMNLLQCTKAPHDDAVQARAYGTTSATVRSPDGAVRLLGSRPLVGERGLAVDAQLYAVGPDGFTLVSGRALRCGRLLFGSDRPVTADCDLARGRATLQAHAPCRVTLACGEPGAVRLGTRRADGVAWEDGTVTLSLTAGRHCLRFPPPPPDTLAEVAAALTGAWSDSRVPPPAAPGLESDAPQMAELWRFDPGGDRSAEVRLLEQADVTADGEPELLLGAEDSRLRCFDRGGGLAWEFEAPGPVCSLWVGDLLGDGQTKLVVGTGTFPHAQPGEDIFILDAAGEQVRRIQSPTTPATANESWGATPGAIEVIHATDVDGDGVREIIAGSTNMHLYCLRPDGEQVWETLNYAHSPNNLQLADVDGNGTPEIVCATNYWETNVFTLAGKRFFRVKGQGPGLAVADIDGDGVTEFVTGSLKGPVAVTEYDPALEFTDFLHQLPGIWAPQPQWLFDTGANIDALRLADLAGDGSTKILTCSRNSIVYALNPDGSVHWARSLGDGVRALEVADLHGDGGPEVLAGNDSGQVFVLSAEGEIIAQAQAPGLVQFVRAQDLDGDGVAEVLAATDGPTLSAFALPGG
ncbi:MAG: hypothetical protein U9R79_14510 [Armatimonadota bacterium]|nr:hypothetical protein [Armatimonadota bacterium]